MKRSDTIVATSSPAGRSLRAIVRLSGPDAIRIASTAFESAPPLRRVPTYRSVEGSIVLVHEGIRCPAAAYVMLAPRSYTREDIVELHTVGSPPLLSLLTEVLLEAGARPAEPGEFTRRAFENGRIDLTQAEAVQAVIQARSAAELRVAESQLGGAFRDAVERLRSIIVGVLAEIEACIDFVEEDVPPVDVPGAARRVAAVADEVLSLAAAEPASPPKEGVVAVIAGLPNAGKSSLLNALAGSERAIVTHVPGTTRDTVEQVVEIDGVAFRLVDTAGARRAASAVEKQAVSRAAAAADAAGLVLLVLDGSRPVGSRARALWERLAARPGRAVIAAVNKSDLPRRLSSADESQLAQRCPVVFVSALRGDGMDDLRAEMVRAIRSDAIDHSAHPFWVGARHRAALRRAGDALGRAGEAFGTNLGSEFAAADLRDALAALGDIVGHTTPDDVLDAIFSRFCIGK